MTHEERLKLIYAPPPAIRVCAPSYPWAGTFVNDYFGEKLDARHKDTDTIYEAAFARELQACDDEGIFEDTVRVRQFIDSQTRSRRGKGYWT